MTEELSNSATQQLSNSATQQLSNSATQLTRKGTRKRGQIYFLRNHKNKSVPFWSKENQMNTKKIIELGGTITFDDISHLNQLIDISMIVNYLRKRGQIYFLRNLENKSVPF